MWWYEQGDHDNYFRTLRKLTRHVPHYSEHVLNLGGSGPKPGPRYDALIFGLPSHVQLSVPKK
jgi:hypothetical protein